MNTIGNISKTKIWISVAIIIFLGILILILNKPKKNDQTVEEPKVTETKKTEVKKTTKPAIPAENLSYSQALTKYGSNRIQINTSCQFSPNNMIYKVGTSVMLDNRSESSKSILWNGTRYSIPGYGFKIMTLSTIKKFQVDCGSYQNVATITVQK